MTVSILIPTLNEEQNIEKVLGQIPEEIDEILIVDGHSTDRTVELAEKFDVRVIYDDSGKGSAVKKGLEEAVGDIVVMMDADLSHGTEEIPLLVEAIKDGYDIAMGSRFMQGGGTDDMTWHRRLGNKIFVFLVNNIWGMSYSDLCYGYRAFNRKAIDTLELTRPGFGIETEISIQAAKKKLRVIEVPSFEKNRYAGQAKLRTLQDGWDIFKTIIEQLFRG